MTIAHRGDEGIGGERPDPGDLLQALAARIVARPRRDPCIAGVDTLLDGLPVLAEVVEPFAQRGRQIGQQIGVSQRPAQGGVGAGDGDAELGEQAAQPIGEGDGFGLVALADAMLGQSGLLIDRLDTVADWPCPANWRAQWCAPEQASMPIRHGGRLATSSTSLPRDTVGLHEDRLACGVHTMRRKDVLRQIDTQGCDGHGCSPSVSVCGDEIVRFASWHRVADIRRCAARSGRGSPFHSLCGTEAMQQLEAFFDTATVFCTWAEGAPVVPGHEVDTAIKMLSKLLALAHELPELFDEEDAPGVTHEEWLAVYKRFGALPFNYYATYSEPHDTETPCPGIGDVADDLADTWRDLKSGIAPYQKGNYAAAAREWRESFSIHWGRHASGALYALQCWRS